MIFFSSQFKNSFSVFLTNWGTLFALWTFKSLTLLGVFIISFFFITKVAQSKRSILTYLFFDKLTFILFILLEHYWILKAKVNLSIESTAKRTSHINEFLDLRSRILIFDSTYGFKTAFFICCLKVFNFLFSLFFYFNAIDRFIESARFNLFFDIIDLFFKKLSMKNVFSLISYSDIRAFSVFKVIELGWIGWR